MIRRAILLATLTFGLSIPCVAAPPALELRLSRNEVQIADPFEVEWTVTADQGTRVVFPPLDERLGEFDVLEQHDAFDVPLDDEPQRRTWTRRVVLETLATGDTLLPAIEISVSSTNQAETLRSDRTIVRVRSVLEEGSDTTQFNDIRGVVDVPEEQASSWAWMGWIAGGVAAVSVAMVLGLALVRRKQWTTPERWAIAELARQPLAGLPELELILRRYLDQSFGMAASSYTSIQIRETLTERGVAPTECDRVVAVLDNAEQEKFAGRSFSETEMRTIRNDVEELIHRLSREVGDAHR